MPKVFIENSSYMYVSMFVNAGFEVVFSKDLADLVCFTGGEDVSPLLYKEAKHPRTFNNPDRDTRESYLFQECLDKKIPMVGVCRGGQFLNVMSGGKMYQHVTNHTRDHVIKVIADNREIKVTSTHHQMMIPGPYAQILATACEGGSKESMYQGEILKETVNSPDIEVVFYKKLNTLCFQPHPEFIGDGLKEMREFFFECINKYLNVKGE